MTCAGDAVVLREVGTAHEEVEARGYLPEGAVVGSVYAERYERDEVCGQRRSTWRLVPLVEAHP